MTDISGEYYTINANALFASDYVLLTPSTTAFWSGKFNTALDVRCVHSQGVASTVRTHNNLFHLKRLPHPGTMNYIENNDLLHDSVCERVSV
jgi:hypothetical protein